jgi:hypothetical protein
VRTGVALTLPTGTLPRTADPPVQGGVTEPDERSIPNREEEDRRKVNGGPTQSDLQTTGRSERIEQADSEKCALEHWLDVSATAASRGHGVDEIPRHARRPRSATFSTSGLAEL